MHVVAGTDTYGRVKVVSGTPIVTKFAMLHFFPLYPMQSFYLIRLGPRKSTGVPLLASLETASIEGIPLASVDFVSVLMAYIRGLCAAMATVGAISLVPGIMYLTGEKLDEFALTATRGLLVALVTGIVGGILTYAIPLTSRRERDIRRYCSEFLGVSADPARLTPELREALTQHIDRSFPEPNVNRIHLIRDLIRTRACIAPRSDDDDLEVKTDIVLDRLRDL